MYVLSMHVSVYVFVVSVCVCLRARVCVSEFVPLFICVSVCPSVYQSVCLLPGRLVVR